MAGAKSRTPGESMRCPPRGRSNMREVVVVCRPSSSRIELADLHLGLGNEAPHQRGLADARLADQRRHLRPRTASMSASIAIAGARRAGDSAIARAAYASSSARSSSSIGRSRLFSTSVACMRGGRGRRDIAIHDEQVRRRLRRQHHEQPRHVGHDWLRPRRAVFERYSAVRRGRPSTTLTSPCAASRFADARRRRRPRRAGGRARARAAPRPRHRERAGHGRRRR